MRRMHLYVFEATESIGTLAPGDEGRRLCLLFLLQEESPDSRGVAEQTIRRAGLQDIRWAGGPRNGAPLNPEALNKAGLEKIVGWYEEALETGICLVRHSLRTSVFPRRH